MKKNGELKIEKGIPLPDPKRRHGYIAEIFRAMKPGDSVLGEWSMSTAYQYASRYIGKGNYTCRVEGKKVRVWRRT